MSHLKGLKSNIKLILSSTYGVTTKIFFSLCFTHSFFHTFLNFFVRYFLFDTQSLRLFHHLPPLNQRSNQVSMKTDSCWLKYCCFKVIRVGCKSTAKIRIGFLSSFQPQTCDTHMCWWSFYSAIQRFLIVATLVLAAWINFFRVGTSLNKVFSNTFSLTLSDIFTYNKTLFQNSARV